MFKIYNQISALGHFSGGFQTEFIDSIDSMQGFVIDEGYAFTCPQRSNYWMGNGIACFEPPQDVGSQKLTDLWDDYIAPLMPHAVKKFILWDSQDFIDYQNFGKADAYSCEVMLKYSPLKKPIQRPHFNFKKITRADSAQMIDIYVAQNGEIKREFTTWFTENRMQSIESGHCNFFSIWNEDENEILAIAGVYWCEGVYRYASVNTRKAYRGKGYASALIAYIRDYALDNAAKEIYIMTEKDNPAAGIYMNAGFEINSYKHSILVDR